jgi:hypothetical protein
MKSKKTSVKKSKTAPKQPKPLTPAKKKYLERCEKRTTTLAKLEKRKRRIKKTGCTYVSSGGEAPCAYMVQRTQPNTSDN